MIFLTDFLKFLVISSSKFSHWPKSSASGARAACAFLHVCPKHPSISQDHCPHGQLQSALGTRCIIALYGPIPVIKSEVKTSTYALGIMFFNRCQT